MNRTPTSGRGKAFRVGIVSAGRSSVASRSTIVSSKKPKLDPQISPDWRKLRATYVEQQAGNGLPSVVSLARMRYFENLGESARIGGECSSF